MVSPNLIARQRQHQHPRRRSARLQAKSSSQQLLPLPPPPPPRTVAAHRQSDVSPTDGANAPSPALQHEHEGDALSSHGVDTSAPSAEDGREEEEEEEEKLRQKFLEEYAVQISNVWSGIEEMEWGDNKKMLKKVDKYLECQFNQWKARNHQCKNSDDQCGCNISSVNPDESGGSPNNAEEEGAQSGEEDDNDDPLADFVFYEEDSVTDDDDTPCVYDAQYCYRYILGPWWDFYWINLCYEEKMFLEENDTPDNWNRVHAKAEAKRGNNKAKTYNAKAKNPLRRRFLKTSYHGTEVFSKCTPHPPFNPHSDIPRIILYENVTVRQALPLIQKVAKETLLETGEYKAMFPKQLGPHSKIAKKFYAEGGELAKIGIAVDSLKSRVNQCDSYIAQLILKYLEQKAGLCLENQKEYDKYRGRGYDDGRVNQYCGILFRCAGIPLLPNMKEYNVVEIAQQIAETTIAHPKYRALQPLLEKQAEVVSFLKQHINLIEKYLLHPDNEPSDCSIYKFLTLMWTGGCQHCIANGVPRDHYRRSVSMSHVQHVEEAGREAKRRVAGGMQPSHCSFDVLLKMDEHQKLLCGEHHLGLEDCGRLARLASGESDEMNTYGQRKILKARALYLAMHLLSKGKCQLDLEDREWILSEASRMDKHHLTMYKDFIDELNKEWDTKKSLGLDHGFIGRIFNLPDGEWQDFIINELCNCAIASKSPHALLHLVFGRNKRKGLCEFLGLELPWEETDTHIIMPRGEERVIIKDEGKTVLSDEHMKDMLKDTSDIVVDDEPGLASWPRGDTEEEDPEYARLSRVLNTLPMERLLARPCLGDDGGLAPELLELWGRNTIRIGKLKPHYTKLPFRMRSSRSMDLDEPLDEELRWLPFRLRRSRRIESDEPQEQQLQPFEQGYEQNDELPGLQSTDNEAPPLTEITLHANSDDQSMRLDEPMNEHQMEEGSTDNEEPTLSDITLHANSDDQSMELDEEQQLQQGYEQNDNMTGSLLKEEQRLEHERERKQKMRIKIIDALDKEGRRAIVGATGIGPRGRRRKGSKTSKHLLMLREKKKQEKELGLK